MGMKNRERCLGFTDDLITDRVPEKDLTRFTCVSKSWRSLIVSTDHDSLLNRPFLVTEKEESVSGGELYNNYLIELDSIEDGNPNPRQIHNPFDDDHDHPRRDARVIASCDGLLVLQQLPSRKMAVWNPTTKEHHVVPPNPAGDDNVEYFGFGYDRVYDCYKLVTRIKHKSWEDDRVLELVIYNVNNGTWKKSRFEGLDARYYERHCPVGCVDGALYFCDDWLSLFEEKKILCFVLAEEEFHDVDLPDFGNVVVFEDRLFLVLNDPSNRRTKLWVMECDYKRQLQSSYSWRWIKFLLISDPKLPSSFNSNIGFDFLFPICVSACRSEILFKKDDAQLFWYDLQKNEFRKLKNSVIEPCVE